MMAHSIERIYAMILRYTYLHKRSVSRALEFVFWPVMELLVWGFLTIYIKDVAGNDLSRTIVFLISAVIFWDLMYRSQQGVTLSFIEDIWTQNILNLLISPLKIWEWLAATFIYGMIKTLGIVALLTVLALIFYHFNVIDQLGFYLIPMAGNILIFGWTLGIFTSGLLIRWGHAVEALIWGVPFLVQPLSAIFYPLSTLPAWIRPISACLPSTYVFEGMREVIDHRTMNAASVWIALGLNVFYFILAATFFGWMYRQARVTGRLARLGRD